MAITTVYARSVLLPHHVLAITGNIATTGENYYNVQAYRTTVVKDNRPQRLPFDTPMYVQRRVFNTSVYRTKGRVGPAAWVYYNVSDAASSSQSTEGEANALKNRAWSNMGSGNLNLGNALGELGSTSAMIADRTTSILSSMSKLRRGDIRGAVSTLTENASRRQLARVNKTWNTSSKGDRVANTWLEMIFGWLPLLSDIHAAVELTNTGLLTTGIEIKSASGSQSPPRSISSYQKTGYDEPTAYHVMPNGKRIATGKDSLPFTAPLAAHASIRAKVKNPALANLQQLGLLNPASIAWELLPMSFVIDWLLPIGTWLNNLTADAGLSDIRGSVVTERRVLFTKVNGTWLEQQQNIWRTPIDGFGIPKFLDMANLTIERALTALALAQQRR